jgi:hypothetical protein
LSAGRTLDEATALGAARGVGPVEAVMAGMSKDDGVLHDGLLR